MNIWNSILLCLNLFIYNLVKLTFLKNLNAFINFDKFQSIKFILRSIIFINNYKITF